MGEYDYIARGDELYDRLRSSSKAKAAKPSGYLGTFGKGFKSELTMGYGVPDEPPRLEGIGEKVAYGAGALAGMIPSFVALSTVTTPLGSAALKVGRLGRLINSLHKMGKVYKIADKTGKARNVTKLGMAVEGAAKSGALFAAHGAAHELPPGEEGALARVKAGAEAIPMGMAFGAAAPLAGGRRLAQIGTAAGIGAGATAISGGTTEDILIQGGLLGAMSALHISVKDAHSFAKQIAGEVDKLPAEQKGAKIAEILDASREDRLDFARTKAEAAPSETDLIREDRLSFAQERAKDQPMGVPGDLPAPEKSRLPGRGVVLGEEPRSVSELLTAEGRPVSEAAEHERIVGALDTEGALRDAIQAVKIRDLQRQEGAIVPGEPGLEPSVFAIKPERVPTPAVPDFERLPGEGIVIGERPGEIPEILTAKGEPVSEARAAATGEDLLRKAYLKPPFLRDENDWTLIKNHERATGVIETPEGRTFPLPSGPKPLRGPGVAARGAFGMRARPEPLAEPTEVPRERFVEARETPEQIEAERLEAEKPERILPQTVDEARIAEEDAAATQKIIEASREERDFAKGQKIREEFYEEAAQKGNAAQASDIIGGGVDRLIDDIGKKRITEKDALSLYEEAVKRNIAIPEKLDEFKRKIKKVSELKVAPEEKPKVEGVEIPEFTTTGDFKYLIKEALKSGKLTPQKYAELHEKDYGPLAKFMPEVAEKPKKPALVVSGAFGGTRRARKASAEIAKAVQKTKQEAQALAVKTLSKLSEKDLDNMNIDMLDRLLANITQGPGNLHVKASWKKEHFVERLLEKRVEKPKEPVAGEGRRPNDKDILNARKIVQAEKSERKKIIEETGFPQGRAYGLIEKIAETPTTKEIKVEESQKPFEPAKPEAIEIPEFETTEDALAFGKTATPQQIELMKTKRNEVLAKIEERKAGGEMPDMAELMRGSYLREAIQSSEGKIVEPEFKPKVEKPAVEVPPIKEEIPAEPVKPEAIAIPELKNTEDALAFGKIATPEQIETLKVKQNESLAKTDILKAEGDLQGAMDEAVRGQFFREAIGSSEGKVAMAPPAPPKPPKPKEVVEIKEAEEPKIVSTPEGKEVVAEGEKPKPEVVPEAGKEPWEISDLAIRPDIPASYVQARKQADGKYKLFFTGTRNEIFEGEVFVSAPEARQFFKVQQVKAQEAFKTEPLSKTKSRLLENIKSEKGSSELINDLSRLGADAIKRGHKSFKAFAIEMKAVLGDAWAKVKHLMQRAYAGSKKILVSEKGAWTIKKGKEKALKAIGIEPRLKEGEPLPGRARSIGLEAPTGKKVYLDVSKEAKGLATELGLSYPKEVVTHEEIKFEADRIMKSDEQLQEVLSKARKEQKLSNPEMLVVRRVNATALETFTDVFKTGKPDEINKKLQTYKEGIFKTTQDLHRQRGQDLNALKIQVQASPDAISNAFAGLKRDLRPQDIDLYDTACKAMKLGNDKPMVSFMKYLEKTKADPELMDYVYEYWYNCILSGVPTHVVNVASNTAWATWQVGVHRPLLAAIDPIVAKFQKRPTEYYLDEIVPMLAGIRKGYKPGKEAAKEIMTKGYTTEASMDKWALDMGKTIGAFARSPNKHLRQIAPFLTIPTRALRAMDVWANQMGFQAELGAICKRMEKQGKGKFKDLMQNPTEEMQKEAAEYAAYTTFMNEPGKLTKWLEKGRDIAPGGRFVMPFVRTIANLTKRGVEMTPGLGIILGRKATGREVTQVAVKQIEGAMIALALASMVADDRITGDVPANKAEREAFYRQGKLPWAIKIGGRWRQFRRLEPFNGPIAAVAIAHDAWKKTGEVPSTELAFRCVMGVVDNILDSSYLSGLTQVLDSVRRSDTAPQKIANMFDRTIASFSPMSSFQRSFVRAFEAMEGEGAIVRKPKGVAETIKAITPGISKEVAARKNIWGKEVVIPGSPLEQWLPWKAARPTKDVVELEIERLHGKTGLPYPGMPAKYMTVRGERIDLTDEQYDYLLAEGGQAAKKRLDRLVGTGYWKTMSDKEKTSRVKRILSDSRKAARNKLKRELGGTVTVPGTRPRYKPRGFVPAAFTGRAFTPAKLEHAGF